MCPFLSYEVILGNAMEDSQGKHMTRLVTFWHSLVLPLLSLLASGIIVAAAIRHLPFSDPSHALLSGLIATVLLSGVLIFILPRLAQELQVCDPSLRQLILGLIAGSIVVVFFSMLASMPRLLAWQWDAGPQAGTPAPVFSAASWDGVNRSIVELHATNDPGATLHGVWRAVASLDEATGVQPVQVELWLTQPSWAVIDATTGRPPPTADGVDVVISVQRGQDRLLERLVTLDPPATPTQGKWHHVTLDLPPGAERLVVEVQMRSTLDYDRVWITEAVVRPTRNAVINQAALMLVIALSVSTFLVFAGRMPPVVSVSRRVVAFFSNYNYGYLLVGAVCLWLGYLLVWQRGLYWDDWYAGAIVRDLRTLEWQPVRIPFERGSRVITWTVYPYLVALLWTHEFPVRLLITVCAGLNGLLLGWLVYRMLRARLPAVIAGWLFLMSNFAPLLTATSAYVFMTGFVLLMLHAIWSALVVDRFQYVWLSGGILALLIALLWVEAAVGIVSLVPIMGILGYVQQPEARRRAIVYRTVLYTLMLTMAVVLYALWVTTTPIAQLRGVTTDISMIIQRAYNWLRAFYYATLDSPNRYYLMYIVGVNYCTSSVFGTVLLSVISVVLVLTVATWKSEQSQYSNITQISVMSVFGIVWFLVTFFIPFVFVLGQEFGQYMMYIPLAGGGVLIGSLIGLITSVIRRYDIQRVLVGVFGVLLMILSICMVGSARLYQVRYETDREVFTTLARLVPPEAISERVQFIPVNLEYSLSGKENMLSPFLDSALEEFWAAEGALTIAYSGKVPTRHIHIQYIAAPRWHPATFSERISDEPANPPCSRFARNTDTAAKGSPTLFVQGCPVDSERAIVFTHRNGELALVRTLTLQRSDGTTRIIELPVVSRLAARGSTVIETLVIPVKD